MNDSFYYGAVTSFNWVTLGIHEILTAATSATG